MDENEEYYTNSATEECNQNEQVIESGGCGHLDSVLCSYPNENKEVLNQ